MSSNDTASPFDGVEIVTQDEGYSEEPLSSTTMTQTTPQPSASRPRALSKPTPHALVEAAMNVDVDDRISLVIQLLRSMPAAKVQDIVNAMYPILHISFLDRLPPEVCLKILGHLDPQDLISLARTSKLAASLSSDWTLWQSLYYREGFLTNQRELAAFEKELEESNERFRHAPPPHTRPTTSGSPPPRKRSRPTPDKTHNHYHNEECDMIDVDPAYRSQSSMFGAPSMASGNTFRLDRDDASDMATFSPSPLSPPLSRHGQPHVTSGGMPSESHSLPSSLTTLDRFTSSRRLNWQFLYKQRRKLEDNWVNERYTNYQIPHPDHPEEAHANCIYTLQHDCDHLVSGSRDWTIRIWSLKTCRLVHPPLRGHKGSVLCLQFDPSKEEDIIISGGSDHTVRIWRFSTGEGLQWLNNAHEDAVLNLKFNKQILVTCSKDRTLKIFNRRKLHPGEQGYKLPKDFVFIPVPQVVNFPGLVVNPYGDLPIKQPYSLIGTLEGHAAAVNACSILGNEVVSVSGDRLAKVWDWPSGACTRSLVGHTKGVACVVYDGRRIVTGSSDCELKVFDRQTGVEVAALKGPGAHSKLVRTVQAGFADIGSDAEVREQDRRKAWAVDSKFFEAWTERPDHDNRWAMDARSRSTGNAGSEKPEDIICYGATLPPGGGGSQYGRIVSGSYDETIIIWRRDAHNVWKPKTTLRQVEAGRAALLQFELSRPEPPRGTHKLDEIVDSLTSGPNDNRWHTELMDALIRAGPDALRQGLVDFPLLLNRFPRLLALIRDTAGTIPGPDGTREQVPGGKVLRDRLRAIFHAAVYREIQLVQYRLMSMDQEEARLRNQIQKAQEGLSSVKDAAGRSQGEYVEGDHLWRQRLIQLRIQEVKMPRNRNPNSNVDASAFPSPPVPPHGTGQGYSFSIPSYIAIESANLARLRQDLLDLNSDRESARTQHRMLNKMLHDVDPPRGAAAAAAAAVVAAAAAGGDAGPTQAPTERERDWNRVYKLQFDARRIVCASNNPIMLVWDFANGDREIEEAARFFRGVE